ncbi:hypothetical protein AVEN_6249-1, partial [Araneus ventricosus]
VWGNQGGVTVLKAGRSTVAWGMGLPVSDGFTVGTVRLANDPPNFIGRKWKRSAKKRSKGIGTV